MRPDKFPLRKLFVTVVATPNNWFETWKPPSETVSVPSVPLAWPDPYDTDNDPEAVWNEEDRAGLNNGPSVAAAHRVHVLPLSHKSLKIG